MPFDVTHQPTVVRRGSSEGTPLGSSGRARLKILNQVGDAGGYALIEGIHPMDEPRIRDHVHAKHEETFLVLEGRYEVRLGQDVLIATVGDYVFVPRGTPHTYRNAGPSSGRLLNIISPCDGLELLAELGAIAGSSIDDTLLAEIHARHAAYLVDPLPGW